MGLNKQNPGWESPWPNLNGPTSGFKWTGRGNKGQDFKRTSPELTSSIFILLFFQWHPGPSSNTSGGVAGRSSCSVFRMYEQNAELLAHGNELHGRHLWSLLSGHTHNTYFHSTTSGEYGNQILSSATCEFVGSDRIPLSQLSAPKLGRCTTLRGGFSHAWEPTHLTSSEMPMRRRGVIPRQMRTMSTFLSVKTNLTYVCVYNNNNNNIK